MKIGLANTQYEIFRAYRKLLRQARVRPSQIDAVCAGPSGGDSKPIRRSMLAWMRKAIPARAHLMTTDAAVALSAALDESAGIIVIAGTGSIAFGRDREAGVIRVGGWGNQFDDAGSGYDIGRKAVLAALRAYDGRGKATGLTQALCAELHLASITEAVPMNLSAQNIASLFRVVHPQAGAGDEIQRTEIKDDLETPLVGDALQRFGKLGSSGTVDPAVDLTRSQRL